MSNEDNQLVSTMYIFNVVGYFRFEVKADGNICLTLFRKFFIENHVCLFVIGLAKTFRRSVDKVRCTMLKKGSVQNVSMTL